MNVNVSIQRNDNLVSPVKIIACWSINMIWKQMSRRSPLCDLNVLFTGNELQLVWKTREHFWDVQLMFSAKKNGIECLNKKHIFANKQKKRENKRREGGDSGVSWGPVGRDHGLACNAPGQSPPEMGVEGGGGGGEQGGGGGQGGGGEQVGGGGVEAGRQTRGGLRPHPLANRCIVWNYIGGVLWIVQGSPFPP